MRASIDGVGLEDASCAHHRIVLARCLEFPLQSIDVGGVDGPWRTTM